MEYRMYDFSALRGLRKREGLSLQELSDRSGVSPSVISKLERNQSVAELDTLYRLARVYDLNPSDLLAFIENRSSHKTHSSEHVSDGFRFEEIRYGNIRCLYGKGRAGSRISRPKIHRDDFEVCWVLRGRLRFRLPNEMCELHAGDAIQFDALLEHTYEAVEDSELMIVHLKKKRIL
jgi:DNA-binding Xre family transcriptional regulator